MGFERFFPQTTIMSSLVVTESQIISISQRGRLYFTKIAQSEQCKIILKNYIWSGWEFNRQYDSC